MGKKICFISSCGGHFMQLLKLIPVADGDDFYVLTERNIIADSLLNQQKYRHHFFLQQDRRKWAFPLILLANSLLSVYFLLKENPSTVITTGAGAAFPTCVLAKLFGKRIIYVESFARVYTASITGRLIYKFADYFYVQWEEMLKIYPKAIYEGSIH